MSVDTLTLAQRLRAAELPAGQAEAIAAAIGAAVLEGAATKDDLIATKLELKADIQAVKADIQASETRLEAKLEALHAKLLTWFISAQVAIGALIVAIVKL